MLLGLTLCLAKDVRGIVIRGLKKGLVLIELVTDKLLLRIVLD